MRYLTVWLAVVCCGCTNDLEPRRTEGPDAGPVRRLDGSVPPDDSSVSDAGTSRPSDGRAFLHADLWSAWWNERTRCGAERTFLHICQQRGEDCGLYQRAWDSCDVHRVVYGHVGPAKQGEELCQRGRFPDVGGCDARAYDFDRLRFHWYGAEWAGNWGFTTLKLFEAGTAVESMRGDGLVALSSHPGREQAAMSGVANHGLAGGGDGCAMLGTTDSDTRYRTPFGAFAWVEVPTDRPVRVLSVAGTNFGGRSFEGCGRVPQAGDPWITDAPGAQLGCVHVVDIQFEPGRHYYFHHGLIEALDEPGPPQGLVEGFAMESVGVDVTQAANCGVTAASGD